MSTVDLNGYVSLVLNLLGNLFLAWKWKSGWLVRIAAIISWGLFGFQTRSNPIMLNAATFFFINCYGWRKWRKEEREAAKLEAEREWFETQRRAA